MPIPLTTALQLFRNAGGLVLGFITAGFIALLLSLVVTSMVLFGGLLLISGPVLIYVGIQRGGVVGLGIALAGLGIPILLQADAPNPHGGRSRRR